MFIATHEIERDIYAIIIRSSRYRIPQLFGSWKIMMIFVSKYNKMMALQDYNYCGS